MKLLTIIIPTSKKFMFSIIKHNFTNTFNRKVRIYWIVYNKGSSKCCLNLTKSLPGSVNWRFLVPDKKVHASKITFLGLLKLRLDYQKTHFVRKIESTKNCISVSKSNFFSKIEWKTPKKHEKQWLLTNISKCIYINMCTNCSKNFYISRKKNTDCIWQME